MKGWFDHDAYGLVGELQAKLFHDCESRITWILEAKDDLVFRVLELKTASQGLFKERFSSAEWFQN